MKTSALAILLFLGISFASCDQTNKETSRNPDTMVMKKDTAIKRIDTAGFESDTIKK